MRVVSIVHLTAFMLTANLSFASQSIYEQLGVRSRAMGGSGRAVATTNEAMYLNPAGLSQFQRFNLDLDYVYRADDPQHFLGLALVDATTAPLAGAVDFHLGIDPSKGNKSLDYLGALALSYTVVPDFIYIGASAKYSYLPKSADDPVQVNQFGLDVGILTRLPYGFSIGASGSNLIPTNSKRLPLSVGIGAGLNLGGSPGSATDIHGAFGGLTIAVDWLARDLAGKVAEHQLSVGGEYFLFDVVPLRIGYTAAITEKEHLLSGGLGFIVSGFGLNGFYEQNLTALDKRSFGFATSLFF